MWALTLDDSGGGEWSLLLGEDAPNAPGPRNAATLSPVGGGGLLLHGGWRPQGGGVTEPGARAWWECCCTPTRHSRARDFEGGAGVRRRRRWRRIGPKRAAPWGVAAAHTTHVCSRERGAGHRFSRHPRPRRLRSSASRAPSFVLCVFCARAAACWRWVARAPPAGAAGLHPWLNVVRV